MFMKRKPGQKICDVNYFTARRLEDMAESLGRLARSFDSQELGGRMLTAQEGLAAMETSAAMVCGDCSRCSLLSESSREDGYYLYYLLRIFEQRGRIEAKDMPQMFQTSCRRKERYLNQLNRNLGRASMNLSWKSRFLESRDAVMVQFRELAGILEEFSRQIDQARDVTEEYEGDLRKIFRRSHMSIRNLLVLEYVNGQREVNLTVCTTNGRCVTAADASSLLELVLKKGSWSPARDSRTLITRQYSTVRFLESGSYRMLCGVSRIPKYGERLSGDNYTFFESYGSRVVMSLSDGMGCGEQADRESGQAVELTQQLIEAGFSPRAALKLVNTVLLLAAREQHPATMDLCCVDLHTGVMESMKMGAAPAFLMGEDGVEILSSGEAPVGILSDVQPEILSKKMWDGNRIVLVSDGVLDALPGDNKEQVMKEYLESITECSPQELADQITAFASSFIPAARDDMTALVGALLKREAP